MARIAPSLLSADFSRLHEAMDLINASEADYFHLDVMDGRFVPNITFGMPVIKALKKHAQKPFDVHLMIVEPEKYLDAFADAGADILTIHQEVSPHLHRSLQRIKALGMKAGVSLNPGTPVSTLEDLIEDIDLVLVMSVNPGFGGQQFIPRTYEKIRQLKQLITERGAQTLIEIDGGVTLENAPVLVAAGADILVAGNTVFSSADPARMIADLKAAH
ncbi:MAG: ribulose-phosphate 3-epimerase [Sphingobacteriales bacterium]|nr:MAG: ribulose-phosphate 3-epimerase [Sphingobacteriales bacterium]